MNSDKCFSPEKLELLSSVDNKRKYKMSDESKAHLPVGIWMNEPDKIVWIDELTKLDCMIVRNKVLGTLCGYVGVGKENPYFEKDCRWINLDINADINFSSYCVNGGEENLLTICHNESSNGKVWWLGFDCAHVASDYIPGYVMPELDCNFVSESRYKNINQVTSMVKELAAILNEAP